MIITALIWFCLLCANPTGLQRTVFFSNHNDWFMDYYNTVACSTNFSPYEKDASYLPMIYIALYPIAKLSMFSDKGDLVNNYLVRYSQLGGILGAMYLVVSFAVLFYVLYKCAKGKETYKIGILAALFVSGTTVFNFDRANFLIITAALLFLFIYSLDSESALTRHMGLAALAIASVLKIFPCVFGLLLLFKKRYRDIALVVVYVLVLALVPFFFLKGGFIKNFNLCIEHLKVFSNSVVGFYDRFSFSEETVINFGFKNPPPKIIDKIVGILAIISTFRLKENWKKIMLITLAMIIAPGTQLVYSIIYLFYPIVMFFNEKHSKAEFAYVICFILILMPLRYSFNIGTVFTFSNIRVTNTLFLVLTLLLTAEGLYGFTPAGKLALKRKAPVPAPEESESEENIERNNK